MSASDAPDQLARTRDTDTFTGSTDPQLMSALVTEHFVLQSQAGTTVGESSSRASIYLASLSSGLVALGFASADPRTFAVMAATVLPVVFVLGCLTVVRLVDNAIENSQAIRRIEDIRRFYTTLSPAAPHHFPSSADPDVVRGVRYGRAAVLYTTATMVGVVNAVVGGVGAALGLAAFSDASTAVLAGVVIAVAAGLLLAVLRYQSRRFTSAPL